MKVNCIIKKYLPESFEATILNNFIPRRMSEHNKPHIG